MRAHFPIASLCLVASCSGATSANPDSTVAPDTPKPDIGIKDTRASLDGQLDLSFSACTLLSDPSKAWVGPGFSGAASAMAECATTKVPAIWSTPSGDAIDLFLKRYPAASQPAKGQLWLLSGGPGESGSVFEHLAFRVGKTIPTVDLYIPDHRGTGKSSYASSQSIPYLGGLTTTDAAKDIAALIDVTRTPSQQVFVLGVSYGTYWAQRYLEVRPAQPTAVILDSTVPAVGMDFADFDKNFDKTAHAVLALCQADATCSAKLGPDPLAKAMEALAAVDAGQCPIAGAGSIRAVFGQFMGLQYYERLLLPASIYRILRCSAADYDWLSRVSTYAKGFWGPFYPAAEHDSQAVFNNIVFSELWPNNPTSAELLAQEQTMIAFWGWPPSWAGQASSWPKYRQDAYYGNWPSSPAPILVLQGTLDPRTPYGSVVKVHYSGPNQYYVEFPKANHGTAWIEAAPTADPTDTYGCGWRVIQSFLADPTKPPNTSCTSNMAPLDFGSPPPWWLARVGIQDLWENP